MDGDDFKTHYGAQTTVGADNCTGEMSYVTARRHRGEPGGVMSLRIGGHSLSSGDSMAAASISSA